MSLFEKYLALGQWISQEEQLALYQYLKKKKVTKYRQQAEELLDRGELFGGIADGEIFYRIEGRTLSYAAKRTSDQEYSKPIRSICLSKFRAVNISKLSKFFAQAEVDVICNFPLPGIQQEKGNSFNLVVYPCYDLNYYSNGKGRILGFFRKLQSNEDELLENLLAS